ncbi:hypothetical protein RNJ44_04547 [Nakaseomyces bracarensis]|uniref:THIF-type NAD/FAD binding fold domain-containing protein n=1 Tax=Nakaseomyces bracarensis TaxID=273131 RepID=A0ABR4NV77_9SACH
MARYINGLVALLYKYVSIGKKLVPGRDVVLILGGSMSKMGWSLCTLLVRRYGVEVINIDCKREHAYLGLDDDGSIAEPEVELSDFANDGDVPAIEQVLLEVDKNAKLHPYRCKGAYTFIECEDLSNAKLILAALSKAVNLDKRITVFINNLQEGLYCQNKGDRGYIDSLELFERCTNINVTNAIIVTKYFISDVIPRVTLSYGRDNDFYIVNLTVDMRNQKVKLPASYFTTKAAITQLHDGLSSEKKIYETTSKIKTLLVRVPETPADIDKHMDYYEQLADMLIKNLKLGRAGVYTVTATIFTNILADLRQFLDQLQ